MRWLWVILIVAVIGGIIGFLGSDRDEDRGANALGGALAGGLGCGYIILQIFLVILGFFILFKIGCWLFG